MGIDSILINIQPMDILTYAIFFQKKVANIYIGDISTNLCDFGAVCSLYLSDTAASEYNNLLF